MVVFEIVGEFRPGDKLEVVGGVVLLVELQIFHDLVDYLFERHLFWRGPTHADGWVAVLASDDGAFLKILHEIQPRYNPVRIHISHLKDIPHTFEEPRWQQVLIPRLPILLLIHLRCFSLFRNLRENTGAESSFYQFTRLFESVEVLEGILLDWIFA